MGLGSTHPLKEMSTRDSSWEERRLVRRTDKLTTFILNHLELYGPVQACNGRGNVKCTLVQALRLCTGGTVRRGSKGIAVLFHDHGTRRGEASASRPGRSLPRECNGIALPFFLHTSNSRLKF